MTHKVHFINKVFTHHSKYSGYHRMLDYIQSYPLRMLPVSKLVPKYYKDKLIEKSLRTWYHYGQTEIDTEISLLFFNGLLRKHVIHFIYGENTFCYSANFNRFGKIFIASYHWPKSWFFKQGTERLATLTEKMKTLDALIAVSRDQAEFLRQFNKNVFFVPHGIDVEFFTPGMPDQRDPTLCLFVGNWLRDFKTLREVSSILKARNSKIRLVAVTPERNRNEFDDTGIQVFSGISDEELRQKYREAALVIQPLIDCTANNAALEAMACGLPLVASDVGGIRDYLSEECAVFCEQGNAEGMADAVVELLNDPAKRSLMGDAGRKSAETHFAWPVVSKQMTDVYKTILKERKL